MSAFNLRIFVFDELFAADESLRGQARRVREAAADLTMQPGDLPPEAQQVLAGLPSLRGRLERAADALTAAAESFGETGTAAKKADRPGIVPAFGKALKENFAPPGEHGPLGPYTWLFGRLTAVNSTAIKLLRHRYGYPHAQNGPPWRTLLAGPKLHPQLRTLVDRADKIGKVAGHAGRTVHAFNNRLRDGASVGKATAGALGESATVGACAMVGAKAGAAVPIPHPGVKLGLGIGGGIVGGAACSAPGKWVGDKVADVAGKAGRLVKDLLPKPPRIRVPW
ncbi:hypothetical protein [Sphaerisporangium dianthi]|uniref:Uncharacterized protein n=1 Tax=Sphaerisporangium dianthi TaxID=1436120 RepID=A0ABV9CJR5_9ACTN